MAGRHSLAALRSDLGALLDQTEIGSRREFGRALGWKTGEEMIRLFLESESEISLGKAADWAERCGAELRAVPKLDPWAALSLAIARLPEGDARRHLSLIANSALANLHSAQATSVLRDVERARRATVRPRRTAANEPRRRRAV